MASGTDVRVAQVGNFGPPHSTENELRRALDALGVDVDCWQENEPGAFLRLADKVGRYDWVLWTRTGWDPPIPADEQNALLTAAAAAGVPTVGYHLDRWWGLGRQPQVFSEPFFSCSVMFTADGGHQQEFAAASVNHYWMPPGVSEFECRPGTPRPEFASDVAFVGSWRPGYHTEWKHRPALIRWLERSGLDVNFWPQPGAPAVRGDDLRDLYASVKVLIGDSCLAGDATHYWSDRIPETVGRGGFLLHPEVEGLAEHFTPGEHLDTWPLGDFDALGAKIAYYLDRDYERHRITEAGRAHVLASHTYTVRMRQVADHLGL